MEIHSQEKKRAQNVAWNAAEDYAFRPEFETFDDRGAADLYWNFITGAARKYYDYSQLADFFAGLKQDADHPFYEELAWIGLENCVYQKAVGDRPVLESLRRQAAERFLAGEYPESFYYLIDELKRAHFQRVLGLAPQVREQAAGILDQLEFDASLSTAEIIQRLQDLIAEHFPLASAPQKKPLFKPVSLLRINLHLKNKGLGRLFRNPFKDVSLISFFSSESKDRGMDVDPAGSPLARHKKGGLWRNFQEQQENKQRELIQSRFGVSMLNDSQVRVLEQAVCSGNHRGCRLHLTRGEFEPKTGSDFKKAILKQKEKNQTHFKQHYARNNNAINQLANILKNTLLVQFEPSTYPAETGQMIAGRVWRSLHLNDRNIFLKTTRDDIGTVSVDILLDASGSQIDREEVLSTQAYIIVESLKCCRIPVRVLSFCTYRNFTVLNLFRDYEEESRDERIFAYHASGCNRDGLALRTALHLMSGTAYDHKILIVLSDGKPIDPHGIATGGRDPDLNFYSDRVGVNDAAFEVRKGRQNGVSILCIFTGQDEDLPAAKKIYGNDLVTIKTPEKFADIVGVMLKNELMSF